MLCNFLQTARRYIKMVSASLSNFGEAKIPRSGYGLLLIPLQSITKTRETDPRPATRPSPQDSLQHRRIVTPRSAHPCETILSQYSVRSLIVGRQVPIIPGITDLHANAKSFPLSSEKWMRRPVAAGFASGSPALCSRDALLSPPDFGANPDTHCLHF